jgi:hypothetical protein
MWSQRKFLPAESVASGRSTHNGPAAFGSPIRLNKLAEFSRADELEEEFRSLEHLLSKINRAQEKVAAKEHYEPACPRKVPQSILSGRQTLTMSEQVSMSKSVPMPDLPPFAAANYEQLPPIVDRLPNITKARSSGQSSIRSAASACMLNVPLSRSRCIGRASIRACRSASGTRKLPHGHGRSIRRRCARSPHWTH